MPYYLIALAAYLLPYVFYWQRLGTGDWDQAATWTQIALWWHQREGGAGGSWNPFLCGGYPLFGNPQVPFFHPGLVFAAVFGPAAGLKVMVLVWMSLGFALCRLFLLDMKFSRRDSSLLSLVWVLNGFFVAHLGQMHAHFVCFFLIPGFYFLIRRWIGTGSLRFLLGFSGLLALCSVHSYGFLAYFVISIPSFFFLELFFQGATGREFMRRVFRRGIPFFAVFVTTLAMLAFYLVPALAYLHDYPRTTPGEWEDPLVLVSSLFFPGSLFHTHYNAWEYQFFLGPWLGYLLLLGLCRLRRAPEAFRAVLACGALHLVLAAGSLYSVGSPVPSPLDVLRAFVPGFGSIRVVSRFWIGAMPAFLLLAGWQWRERGVSWKTATLAILPLLGFLWHNTATLAFRQTTSGAAKPRPRYGEQFHWALAGKNQMYATLEGEQGVADCYESTPIPRRDGAPFVGPLVEKPPVGMRWRWLDWGHYRFDSPSPGGGATELGLAMNHHRHWRIENRVGEARIVSAPLEPLRVSVGAGPYEFDLLFEDPHVAMGRVVSLWASLLWAALLVGLWFRRRLTSCSECPPLALPPESRS